MLGVAVACQPPETPPSVPLGSPLHGLDETNTGRFRVGEALFNRVFVPEDGLGPLFNDNQCSACHTVPATGGTGDQLVTRASRTESDGRCNLLSEAGGENVRLQATPAMRAHGIEHQPMPAGATEQVRFNVPFVFGMGLLEAIPEKQILERADPDDRDRDGISGRPGRDTEGRFARFGRKADQPTLRAFVEIAAHLEMGLTTPAHPKESVIEGLPFPEGVDPKPEPELTEAEVELLTDFVRFLAPPSQMPVENEAERRLVERGEELFRSVGCSGCHTPSMTTGRHPIKALSRKQVYLYSDLLLHDMGPDLANVCAPGATRNEMRTEPLMGLGRRSLYLHDGRANDLTQAILLHGGEASGVRARFQALSEGQKHALLRFLQSL